jgi:hypothetical protein
LYAKGRKTRNTNKYSQDLIVQRRVNKRLKK